jgi:pyrimidine-nucleoside phosphorylase
MKRIVMTLDQIREESTYFYMTNDYGAGIMLRKKTGDFVKEGECRAEFYCNDASLVPNARQRFLDAITWGDTAPAKSPLIFGIVG